MLLHSEHKKLTHSPTHVLHLVHLFPLLFLLVFRWRLCKGNLHLRVSDQLTETYVYNNDCRNT